MGCGSRIFIDLLLQKVKFYRNFQCYQLFLFDKVNFGAKMLQFWLLKSWQHWWFLMSFFDIVRDCFQWNCNELSNQSTVTRLCYYQIWPLVMAFCIESLQLCVLFKTNFKKYSKLNLTVLNWRWTLFNKFFMDNTD